MSDTTTTDRLSALETDVQMLKDRLGITREVAVQRASDDYQAKVRDLLYRVEANNEWVGPEAYADFGVQDVRKVQRALEGRALRMAERAGR